MIEPHHPALAAALAAGGKEYTARHLPKDPVHAARRLASYCYGAYERASDGTVMFDLTVGPGKGRFQLKPASD